MNRKLRQGQAELIEQYRGLLEQVEDTRDLTHFTLNALRRNCFITNEKGHRVRYFDAYGCSWDWQCDTYDEGEGTCLCTRRCEWCTQPSAAELAERKKLQDVLANALAKDQTL